MTEIAILLGTSWRAWIVGDVNLTIACSGARIYKEGLTERAIMLCKLNKSRLVSSTSVGIHRQKILYSLKNLCIQQTSRSNKMWKNGLFIMWFHDFANSL